MGVSYVKLMAMVLAVLGVIALLVWIVKRRLYVQTVLAVAAALAVACSIAGYSQFKDTLTSNNTQATILCIAGIALLIVIGVVTKVLYFPRK